MHRIIGIIVVAFSTSLSIQAAPTSDLNRGPDTFDRVPGESSGPLAGTGTVYLSDSNSYETATPFYAYDIERDEWSSRAPLPATNTTQLASDGDGTVLCLPEDGVIYRYDDEADAWRRVMDGPTNSVGRNAISLFEANEGTYVWGKDGGTDLFYHTGDDWQRVSSPQPLSCAASTDRGTGLVYIRIYGALGFMVFDPRTGEFPTTCSIGGSVGENGRFGSFTDGEFFTREWSGTIQATGAADCGVRDTRTNSAGEHSGGAEDGSGRIYMTGWSNTRTVFEVYDIDRNEMMRLADCPDIPSNSHSTLAVSSATIETGGLELFLSSVPETAQRGSTVAFRADVVNTGEETDSFDSATLHVTSPASVDIPIYEGRSVPVPSQGTRGSDISVFVPLVAPTGEYNVELEILFGEESLASDGFSVTVTD